MPDANKIQMPDIVQMTDVEQAEAEALVGDLPSRARTLGKKVMLGTATVSECVECAIMCAESLLPQFKSQHPYDNRPDEATNATLVWLQDPKKPENYQKLEQLHNDGWLWSNSYAAPSRRAAQAAWRTVQAAWYASQVDVEEKAVSVAQKSADQLREKAEHWVDGPEGTAKYAEQVEAELIRARAAAERAVVVRMYRRRTQEIVSLLEASAKDARADANRALRETEAYEKANMEVGDATRRKSAAIALVRNAAREAVRLAKGFEPA